MLLRLFGFIGFSLWDRRSSFVSSFTELCRIGYAVFYRLMTVVLEIFAWDIVFIEKRYRAVADKRLVAVIPRVENIVRRYHPKVAPL